MINPLGYDMDNQHTEEDYFHWLENEVAEELKFARGNEQAMKFAIRRYLEIGYNAHISSGELVDYFCVSTPSVLAKAGYTEEETDYVVKFYDQINVELFPRYHSCPEIVNRTSFDDENNPPLPKPRI